MKILHTSDWHLGRSLYGRKRYQEFSLFLNWLQTTIETEKIDALLVAGDVFDTSTPSNRAQELYYDFLCKVAQSNCRHIIIIAGNHDSPTFLNAPKELLRVMNVHVVGAMSEDVNQEVLVLNDKNQNPEAIVCAVPYLRDRDIRMVESGESLEDKNQKLLNGIRQHYKNVVTAAENERQLLLENATKPASSNSIPIIAMGHLFTAGGKTTDDDGVRELYVGSLAHVNAESFDSSIDYLALGHLHVSQMVGGAEHMRYSGSPIPMGFGEAKQEKSVVLLDFKNPVPENAVERESQKPDITIVPVPCFQTLVKITGSLETITKQLEILKKEESRAWLEIEYTGAEVVGNLKEKVAEIVEGSTMEVLRIKNKRLVDRVIQIQDDEETLERLTVQDVFSRCLDSFEVPDEERSDLTQSYNEIIQSMHEEDERSE